MDFATAFWSVFCSQPRRALAALYWRMTGRKTRARNRLRIGLAQHPDSYRHWMQRVERLDTAIADAPMAMSRWAYRPLFSILLHQDGWLDQAALDALSGDLGAQVYPEWELVVVPQSEAPALTGKEPRIRIADRPAADAGQALRVAAFLARGDHLVPLPTGARLSKTALYRYAEALQTHPDAALLFGDHDEVDDLGKRQRPWFKPQWNAELALAQDYLSQATAFSARAARSQLDRDLPGGRAAAYALALAIAASTDATVRHLPHIQAHLRPGAAAPDMTDRLAVVRDHLNRSGMPGAEASAAAHDTIRVDWPLPSPCPSVSIIIPTRDRIDLLKACLSSLEARTTYQLREIIVVDNGSVQADSLAYLNEIAGREGTTVIRDERPYNFSQLNNLAVSAAQSDYLCLLNNDTEVIDGDWLAAMMRQAVRPHVGAVGARLLYDDGSIQHAGVIVGMGDAAGHAHRFQKKDAIGYFARTHAAHYVSAVTAACLVVEKRKYLAVGGLDETRFAVAFNDVDLCLKLGKAGWRNVYTPHATLLHHESKSRGKDFSPQHIDRYRSELKALQEGWASQGYPDPLHHPHLDRTSEQYLIRL